MTIDPVVVDVLSTEPVIDNEFKDDAPDTLNEFNIEVPVTDNEVIDVFARVVVPVEVSPFKLVDPVTDNAVAVVVASVESPVVVTVVKLAVGAVSVVTVAVDKVLFPVTCNVLRIVAPETVSDVDVSDAKFVALVTVRLNKVARVLTDKLTNVPVVNKPDGRETDPDTVKLVTDKLPAVTDPKVLVPATFNEVPIHRLLAIPIPPAVVILPVVIEVASVVLA